MRCSRADPLEGPVRSVANLERLIVSEAQLGAALAVMRRRLSGLPPSSDPTAGPLSGVVRVVGWW